MKNQTLISDLQKDPGKIKLWQGLSVLAVMMLFIGIPGAYHYVHLQRYDDEGIAVMPDPQNACAAAEKTAFEVCREQLEEAWFNDGAHYYTPKQMEHDLPICRKMSDAVLSSCKSYGKQ